MGSQAQLELGQVDPASWHVKSGDTVYGPYTLGQMTAFIAEQRVTRHTLVRQGGDGVFRPAATIAELGLALARVPEATRAAAQDEPANYLIVTRVEGEGEHAVTAILNGLGRFAEATNGVFILRSTVRLAKIRERLAAVLGSHDRFVIVDASRNRVAWLNLGPETDVHLRSVWDSDLEA